MATDTTICVIDDDGTVRDSLRELLESADYAVEDYDSAIRFLASDAVSRSRCLIVDVRMPEMDGLALQRELVKRGHRLPVIVVTGHGDVPLAVRAMKAGAADFLEKPFNDETLLASIRMALQSAAYPATENPAAPVVVARMKLLTDREREVLDLLVLGHANKVVAQRLSISFRTVEIHRARVLSKMEARSIAELVRMVLAVRPD
ncbi:MAG: response regulator [Rhizomicrobium sp.]